MFSSQMMALDMRRLVCVVHVLRLWLDIFSIGPHAFPTVDTVVREEHGNRAIATTFTSSILSVSFATPLFYCYPVCYDQLYHHPCL